MCADYRKLNQVTEKNSHPLPLIDEVLEQISKANYFTNFDWAKGFHQFSIDQESIEKTAITTHVGLFQFKTIPFGLCNAPTNFQRCIDVILNELKNDFVSVFMNDIVGYFEDFNTHLLHLEKLFSTLAKAGLKIKPSKSELGMKKVD